MNFYGMIAMNKKLILYPMLVSAGLVQAQEKSGMLQQKSDVRQQKPNVVIIFTDDQGYQDLGCYGSPLIQTPSIDRMAGEGMKLTDFYVSASVSSASRAGLLTGRLNTRNGVKGVFFPESAGMPSEEITLAEALKEQGYATGCFGKWHLGDSYPARPQDLGFDEVITHHGGGIGQAPDFFDNDYFDDTYLRNGVPEKQEGYCTDVWFDEAIKFIENKKYRILSR